jgi:peptidoglycan glycosyltransferase
VSVNGAIARLAAIFVAAFCLLFARQFYVQVVQGPRLMRDPHDPRLAILRRYRGPILASDGTVLARSGPHGRVYPFGAALAHVVGYDSIRYGTAGLEAAYDGILSARLPANDPLAQLRAIVDRRARVPALAGTTVVTTIEPAVETVLADALAPYARAAGVVLDPRTGAVLALASSPSFDPGRIDATFPALASDAGSPLLDRALDGLYPPGSTFKIFTAASALATGVVTPESTFVDSGRLVVGPFVVHDDEGEATGTQDLAGAFALSSNVDFAQIALALGVDRWFDAARDWRLGDPVDFELPAARDRLPERAEVTPSILAQLGFGQADLLVTPLRMACVAATIASGGVEPHPYLVRDVRDDAGDRRVPPPPPLATPIGPDVAAEVRDLMIATVERGTGRAAALPGVTIAGKTGTATNAAGRAHAWFVAFAPADAPRVAVAIVVEHAGYGGTVAAPIARRVIAAALARER